MGEGRKQPKIDIHRLERARPGVDRLHVAPGDVSEQRADRGGRRRRLRSDLAALGSGEAAGQEPDRGRFDIALAAGDLPGKAQLRLGPQPQRRIDQLRRIEEGVTVQPAEPGELRRFQSRDRAQDADLFPVFELGLESDHVEQRAQPIVLTELHDRVGLLRRLVRIGQPDRLHRPVAQGIAAALGHHLDRQAAIEVGSRRLPFAECDRLGRAQRIDERLVTGPVERAVDVIGARADGGRLVVA